MAETITIKDTEIFAVGTHNRDFYALSDLLGIISAANEVGFTPPVKIGHMTDGDTTALLKAEGMPAFGWIKNLRMKGDKLVCDLCEVPRRVAELIRNGAYKRLSAEIYWNFSSGGRTWPRVLKAVSLLGAEVPAVTSLKEIEALYGAKPYASDLPPGEVKMYMGEIAVAAPSGSLQKDRMTAGYREGDDSTRCGTCRFFLGMSMPGCVGACGLVMGEIASDAVCDLYEVREAFEFEGWEGDAEKQTARVHAADGDNKPTVEQMRGQHCVMQGGKMVKCFPSKEEADAHMATMMGEKGAKDEKKHAADEGKPSVEQMRGQHCVMQGGKQVKCFPTKAEADAHMATMMGEKQHAVDPDYERLHPRDAKGMWMDKPGGGEKEKKGDGDPHPRYPSSDPERAGRWMPPGDAASDKGGKKIEGVITDAPGDKGGASNEPSKPRPLFAIAREIQRSWKDVNFAAKPYLSAMIQLNSIDDNFMADSGYSVVAYFLGNAKGWKGEDAKRIKAELKGLMKGAGRKHFAYATDAEGKEIVVELHDYKITKRGDQWCVLTADGSKTLGCHDSEEKAQAQLGAVEASKVRAAKDHAVADAVLKTDEVQESEPMFGGAVVVALGDHQIVKEGETWYVVTADRLTTLGEYADERDAQLLLATTEESALEAALTATPEQRLAMFSAQAKVASTCAPMGTPSNIVVAVGDHQIIHDDFRWFVARVDGTATVGEYATERDAQLALADVENDVLGSRTGEPTKAIKTTASSEPPRGAEEIPAAPSNADAAVSADAARTLRPSGQGDFPMSDDVKKLQEDLATSRVRVVQLEQELAKTYQKVEANARATEENAQMHSKIAELQARVVEMETRDLDRDDKIILDNLVAAGKLLPAEREIQEKLLTGGRGLAQSYSENGVRRERPMRIALLEALEKRPNVVQFGEVSRASGGDDGLQHADPAIEIENRVRRFRESNPAATYEIAYKAVLASNPKLKDRYASRSVQQ